MNQRSQIAVGDRVRVKRATQQRIGADRMNLKHASAMVESISETKSGVMVRVNRELRGEMFWPISDLERARGIYRW